MRKVKHFAGYGTVMMGKVKDNTCTLHVRLVGNHECGLAPRWMDLYTMWTWIVCRFDKSIPDYETWWRMDPSVHVIYGYTELDGKTVDTCDYLFSYGGD